MSETKHTPGPWCLDPHQRPEDPLAIYDGPNCGALIASMPGDPDETENEANARLIAAAPELLESLVECLAIVRLKCGNLHDDTNAIQAKATAAIAKATN